MLQAIFGVAKLPSSSAKKKKLATASTLLQPSASIGTAMVFSPPRVSCSRHSHTSQKQVCQAFYHPNSKSMNLLEYLGLAETCELQSSIAMQSLLSCCINPTQRQVHHQRLQSKPWSSTGPEKRCRKHLQTAANPGPSQLSS